MLCSSHALVSEASLYYLNYDTDLSRCFDNKKRVLGGEGESLWALTCAHVTIYRQ